ncbi:aldo/keto reductase [Turicibacter sanguinis]|nr:aldo/keto reductase [Turicibacter sanguinis]MDB8438010.1 aldo/keto reductase [Turicibacter sanguinis]MDB8564175.1 aldo/keto reductase [Turicibacter sanguinis]MDB8566137.1 aldo/keto reductase [Turicibacter sanguinis]MDB8568999.1 aldo/keto reductase [Turicibacter sanguinis]MDB8571638.1 aldo/keto reductase [Turicibacter sanguinis]
MSIIEAKGLRPLSVIQPQYHMLDRYIEDEIMDLCERYGIGIVPFSPLAQGLLTGKYRKSEPIPQDSRATLKYNQVNAMLTDDNLEKVEALLQIAHELGISLPVLSLAWILRRLCISGVITGASKPEQIEKNVQASAITLSEDLLNRIDHIIGYTPLIRRIG